MPPPPHPRHRVRVLTLAREEIRALPRNAFALGATGAVLALFAPVAAFLYAEEDGLVLPLVFAWLVAQLVVAIVLAARVAAARRSRFVESLYTTPLRQPTWLLAQAAVGVVLAALVLVAQVPFILVYVLHLGLPPQPMALVTGALLMGAFAVALGLFCGVAVGEAGPGAAAGLAGGIAFASFLGFIFHGVALLEEPASAAVVRVTSLSPLTLVTDALGLGFFRVAPADPWRPLVGVVAMTLALAAGAWVAYTRAQSPLGWDSGSRAAKAVVAALAAVALVVPVATAELDFEALPEEPPVYRPGEHTHLAFVPRGAPVAQQTFSFAGIAGSPGLSLGKDVELDALVLLSARPETTVRDVRIEVVGSDRVRVVAGGTLSVPDGRSEEGVARRGSDGALLPDEPRIPVFRVPVTLRLLSVDTLGESDAPVEARTSFLANGTELRSVATLVLKGQVDGVHWQLGLAGLPVPALALGALVRRSLSTR